MVLSDNIRIQKSPGWKASTKSKIVGEKTFETKLFISLTGPVLVA
jgi:hypothetical protein